MITSTRSLGLLKIQRLNVNLLYVILTAEILSHILFIICCELRSDDLDTPRAVCDIYVFVSIGDKA